jgi:hypothetical protein
MTGIASPEDGIGRVIIGSAAIALVVLASSNSDRGSDAGK